MIAAPFCLGVHALCDTAIRLIVAEADPGAVAGTAAPTVVAASQHADRVCRVLGMLSAGSTSGMLPAEQLDRYLGFECYKRLRGRGGSEDE